jgi:hypothetical protein
VSYYFTDRAGDLPPRIGEELPKSFIAAVVLETERLCDTAWLARDWPIRCEDYPATVVVATNRQAFWRTAQMHLRLASAEPMGLVHEDSPLKVLNLIEFVFEHIAAPERTGYHKAFGHDHLKFTGLVGKDDYISTINGLFQRYGLAYTLDADGRVTRLVPEVIEKQLLAPRFKTGDPDLDELLETARVKFRSPSGVVRREGLEKLWDAFERLKTVEEGRDKKSQVANLVARAYVEAETQSRLDLELKQLTEIGNKFRIRHFERDRIDIPDDAFVDYLFQRCYAVIDLLLQKTGRVRRL